MTKEMILQELLMMSRRYEKDGVLLLGLFGSFSRGTQSNESDLDILIETNDHFLSNFSGFGALKRLESIKQDLENHFHRPIDLVDKTGLLQHGNTHILEKTLYV